MPSANILVLAGMAIAFGFSAFLISIKIERRALTLRFIWLPECVLIAVLIAIIFLRLRFLQTAALSIPVLTLYFFTAKQTTVPEAIYLACVTFLLYDLGLLFGGNLIAEHLDLIWPQIPGWCKDTIWLLVGSTTMLGSSYLLGRRTSSGEFKLSTGQSFLILVPMIPYLYIRSGIYMMAFNGWNAAPYEGELILIILSLLPTIVVMVITKETLNTQIRQNELLKMEALLTKQHQQYLIKRETIDLLNRKYHDMKHFANILQSDTGTAQANTAGQEMVRDLLPYSEFVETGNPLLDVILADKIEYCNNHDIRLLPLVDARNLDFMSALDICCIFGNALDNAIAATEDVKEEEMREIRLRVGTHESMIAIVVTNHYESEPLMQNGIPVRKETQNAPAGSEDMQSLELETHGYGIQNLCSAVERYGGETTFKAENKTFTVDILIPFPKVSA